MYKTRWRNVNASDSRSKGCVFKSHLGQKPFLYLKTASLLHCNIYFNMSLYKTPLRNCSVFDSRSKGCMFKSCGVKCTEIFFTKAVSLLNCIIYFNTSLFKTPWRNGSASDSR